MHMLLKISNIVLIWLQRENMLSVERLENTEKFKQEEKYFLQFLYLYVSL